MNYQISFAPTPNPATMRFQVDAQIMDKGVDFPNAQEAQRSPLATKLFGFPWTNAVYIGSDFITVTKQDWVDWDVLAEPLAGLIREHLENGEAIYHDLPEFAVGSDDDATDSEIVKQIKKILNNEIRPAVAMDGGDITFAAYTDGVLAIQMKGACAGCPSSTATLKEGIEVRFKELLPEIKEVISV